MPNILIIFYKAKFDKNVNVLVIFNFTISVNDKLEKQ